MFGTIGILIFNSNIDKRKFNDKNIIIKSLLLAISANIFIMPIIAYTFNEISLVFLVSNILITPFLGITLIMGFISAIIPIFPTFYYSILSFILAIIISITKMCSSLSFGRFLIISPGIFSILIYYICIIYMLNYNKIKKQIPIKIVCLFLIIIILASSLINLMQNDLRIYFIDVGQGDSTLVITPNGKTILIDGGGSENNSYDVGEKVLIPYLLDRHISSLDYILISHFDIDHVGRYFNFTGKI